MLKVAVWGGAGEHGRSCYYVENESYSVMLDCGGKKEAGGIYPLLDESRIGRLNAVFLSHAHEDHSMALPLLYKLGYQGEVWTTKATAAQLPNYFRAWMAYTRDNGGTLPYDGEHVERIRFRYLEEAAPAGQWFAADPGLQVCWGASGHMAGSVWLKLALTGERVFYSGDYCAEPYLLRVDPPWQLRPDAGDLHERKPRGEQEADNEQERRKMQEMQGEGRQLVRQETLCGPRAGGSHGLDDGYGCLLRDESPDAHEDSFRLAIIDAAYGPETVDQKLVLRQMASKIRQVLGRGGHVLLPVPLLGRGQELALLLREMLKDVSMAVEAELVQGFQHFLEWPEWLHPGRAGQIRRWLQNRPFTAMADMRERLAVLEGGQPHIILTTDGMLQNAISRWYYDRLKNDARHAILFTGHVSPDGFGTYVQGKAECEIVAYRYKIHQDKEDVQRMVKQVSSGQTLLVHSGKQKTDALQKLLRSEGYERTCSLVPGDTLECPS